MISPFRASGDSYLLNSSGSVERFVERLRVPFLRRPARLPQEPSQKQWTKYFEHEQPFPLPRIAHLLSLGLRYAGQQWFCWTLQSLADLGDCVVTPKANTASVSIDDAELELHRANGQFSVAIARASADGMITSDEERELLGCMAAIESRLNDCRNSLRRVG